MSRKERRRAARAENVAIGAAPPAPLLGGAVAHYRGGRLGEADALCARLLTAEPRHLQALHLRATIARQQNRPGDAVALFTRALSAAPNMATPALAAPALAALHEGLAETLQVTGQRIEAERHYRRVAELQPGAATLLNLGNALLELQRFAEAAESFQSALRINADLPDAWYGLGTALSARGAREAADAFLRAIARRPDFALAHEALNEECLAAGAWDLALKTSCEALLHADTPRLRTQFVDAVIHMPGPDIMPQLPEALPRILQRALAERWTRPQELARATCDVASRRSSLTASDTLLRSLLHLAPLCHPEAERALTQQRRLLLQHAAGGVDGLHGESLQAACALASQCFINEYAWHCEAPEARDADALARAIEAELQRGAPASEAIIVAVAMYRPLASLRQAERLLAHPCSSMVSGLLAQQLGEPAEENRLRGAIPRATSIDDRLSQMVRDQYEANPYPRWVTTAGAMRRVHLREWLLGRFPGAGLAPLPAGRTLEVLVAGCGTGQQALETVRCLADVRVLAVDLSLASLAYAARMTAALGVETIEYAQADLLRLAELGRSFDMIGVGGVLHHLADPWAGWHGLLERLRPGGVMNVLLYTVRGRSDVAKARAWIAGRGIEPTPDGLRGCRHEIAALAEDWAVRLRASPDFASISGCRDLLFHVQEQAVTPLEVAAFLEREGATLLGVEVSASTERAFAVWNGGAAPEALRDLARWDRFEAEHPGCFAGMLNLWIQKPARAGRA